MILDPLRRKFVKLTPEEWVRQHFVQYLIYDRGCPRGLIAIEKGFMVHGALCRADVMVADRSGKPLLLTECKAPDVRITQRAFDQLARYNMVLKAPYLAVSNGSEHYCCRADHEKSAITFLDAIPSFDDMTA